MIKKSINYRKINYMFKVLFLPDLKQFSIKILAKNDCQDWINWNKL